MEDPCEVILATCSHCWLWLRVAVGRFSAEEDMAARARVVILSYGLWQRTVAADERVIGRAFDVNGDSYTSRWSNALQFFTLVCITLRRAS